MKILAIEQETTEDARDFSEPLLRAGALSQGALPPPCRQSFALTA